MADKYKPVKSQPVVDLQIQEAEGLLKQEQDKITQTLQAIYKEEIKDIGKNSQLHQYTATADPMVNTYNLQSAKLYQVNGDAQSAIRIQDEKTWKHKEILNQMSTILAGAIQETQKSIINKELLQDKGFIKHVVAFAQEKGGVGNVSVDEWLQYSKSTIKNNYPDDKQLKQGFNIAKELSRQYQIAAEKHQFLTGRTENLKVPLVGQRLFRIPKGKDTETIVNEAMARNLSKIF